MKRLLLTLLIPLLALTHASAAPTCDSIPSLYLTPSDQPGELKTEMYRTKNVRGEDINKDAFVYLPYGYSPTEKYDVLYLIHGGGETGAAVMGTPPEPSPLKYLLDNLIEHKRLNPIIVVAPTFYTDGGPLGGFDDSPDGHVHGFQEELRTFLIPYIENKYSTNTTGTSKENLAASRLHRAIGGFSMGGACTWYAFLENLDLISKFIPLSGDCWILGTMGGGKYPEATAKKLGENIAAQGLAPSDFFIFAATGSDDIAYPALPPMIEAMKQEQEFNYGPDKTSDNLYYIEATNGQHSWPFVTRYLYNILPFLFPPQP